MNVTPLKSRDVKDAKTFASWVQSTYGVPPPTVADIKTLHGKARRFFDTYPEADWQTFVQVAQWCASKKRRVARVWGYIDQYRFAWADHAVDVHRTMELDEEIVEAIQQETDPAWRSRLRRAVGSYRAEVLEEWKNKRSGTPE